MITIFAIFADFGKTSSVFLANCHESGNFSPKCQYLLLFSWPKHFENYNIYPSIFHATAQRKQSPLGEKSSNLGTLFLNNPNLQKQGVLTIFPDT
jgi:hypothetical protein